MNGLGWAQVAPPQDTAKHRAYQIERKGYVFSSSSRGRGFVGKADFWLGEKEKSRLLPLKRKWKKCEKVESGYDRKIFPPAETWKVKRMGKSRWESGMAENPHTHRGEMCGVEKRSGGGYIRFEKENAAGDKRDFAPFHRASSTKKRAGRETAKKGAGMLQENTDQRNNIRDHFPPFSAGRERGEKMPQFLCCGILIQH